MRMHTLQRGFFGGLGLDVGIGRGHLVAGGGADMMIDVLGGGSNRATIQLHRKTPMIRSRV